MSRLRNSVRMLSVALCGLLTLLLAGCGGDKPAGGTTGGGAGAGGGRKPLPVYKTTAAPADMPSFSLAWSEYPSWSTFGVADESKLVSGKKGELGELERKWGVDLELVLAEYDPCINLYTSNKCDAVCITNMDVLNPSLGRKSVAVLPNSTSFGADALIVTNDIPDIKALKGKKVHGLSQSVSEYCFVRNLELLGEKESDYTFSQMDPGAAAIAMQQKAPGMEAIVVWNPFVLQTLATRKDTKVLFDSTKIPNEIIDMVVVGQNSIDKPKSKEMVMLVLDTYYTINKYLADKETRDATLKGLGEKFAKLDLKNMEKCVEQTKFFDTPEKGRDVLKSTLKEIMPKVTAFCVSHGIVKSEPSIGYGDAAAAPGAVLRFDPTYLEEYLTKK